MNKKKLDKPILAEGEVTGHSHRLQTENIDVFEDENGIREFENKESVELNHEEHNTIILPAEKWRVGKVREYMPLEKKVREVRD